MADIIKLLNERADAIEGMNTAIYDAFQELIADRDRWIQCAERLVESQEEALEFYRDCQRRAREQVMRDGK